MLPTSAMVLTGKQALDFSGGVSAEDNLGIGGYDRVMGPNGQAQYWAPTVEDACRVLLRHYDHTYVVPGERFPRRAATTDPLDRDVRTSPHAAVAGTDLHVVGDIFSDERNPERKKPFDVRSVLRAVADADSEPLERWNRWRGAETAVVWDAHVGGIPVCMLGLESRTLARRGYVPADGPSSWSSGTLFPQSARKVARAINASSGNRPVVVLANLSGFDGSPESMRHWQLEYGAEIGRAVTNFAGPIVFVVISRYHGGAFVVFSKKLNVLMEIAAVEGSYASVIGGAPAAATVFAREVRGRTDNDPRVGRAPGGHRRGRRARGGHAARAARAADRAGPLREAGRGRRRVRRDPHDPARTRHGLRRPDHPGRGAAPLRRGCTRAWDGAGDGPGRLRPPSSLSAHGDSGRLSHECAGRASARSRDPASTAGGGSGLSEAIVTRKTPSRRHQPGMTPPSTVRTSRRAHPASEIASSERRGVSTVTSTLRVSRRRPVRSTFKALSLADQIRFAAASRSTSDREAT